MAFDFAELKEFIKLLDIMDDHTLNREKQKAVGEFFDSITGTPQGIGQNFII